MTLPLFHQTALISGGLGDIGAAIALELAMQGADVALGDVRPPEAAQALCQEITSLGRRALYTHVDASKPESVQRWLDQVQQSLDVPTLIIPNAAIVKRSSWDEVTAQDWQQQIDINLSGAFFVAQQAAHRLVAAKQTGRVVFVGSWAAHAPHTSMIPYSVSKAGLRMLCQCLALELAPHGILVNELAPGFVDAGLTGQIFDKTPGLRQSARESVPNNQLITAQEVAQQAAWLCHPQNQHMAGATLLMDGGLSLKRR